MKFEKVWESKLAGVREGGARSPLILGNLVIFSFYFKSGGSNGSKIIALDLSTKKVIWEQELEHIITPLTVIPSSTNLLLVLMNGTVLSVDSASGHINWSRKVDLVHCNLWSPVHITAGFALIPETAGNSRHIYCLDVLTGNTIWSWDAGDSIKNTLAIGNQFFIVGNQLITALDIATGSVVKRQNHNGITVYNKIFAFNNNLILINTENSQLLLDAGSLDLISEMSNPDKVKLVSVLETETGLLSISSTGVIFRPEFKDNLNLVDLVHLSPSSPIHHALIIDSGHLLVIGQKFVSVLNSVSGESVCSKSFDDMDIKAGIFKHQVYISGSNGSMFEFNLVT